MSLYGPLQNRLRSLKDSSVRSLGQRPEIMQGTALKGPVHTVASATLFVEMCCSPHEPLISGQLGCGAALRRPWPAFPQPLIGKS